MSEPRENNILRPREGWRVFAGEVGVIVLGVLLALGAQQVVEDLQIKSDVDAFRRTIDNEVAMNLFVMDAHVRQFSCAEKQLDEARGWLEKARTGAAMPATYFRGSLTFDSYQSAWANRDADTFRRLPADVRQGYAMFYDLVGTNNALKESASAGWSDLTPFREPGPVTLEERRALRPALSRIRIFTSYKANSEAVTKIAKRLGIAMTMPEDIATFDFKSLEECQSIYEPPPPPKPSPAALVPAKG